LVRPRSEVVELGQVPRVLRRVRDPLLYGQRLKVRVLLVEEGLRRSELFLTHEVGNVLLGSSDWLVRNIHVWVLLHLQLRVRTSWLQHAFLVLLHVVLLLLLVEIECSILLLGLLNEGHRVPELLLIGLSKGLGKERRNIGCVS
jgi:hypothetical protein